MRRRPAHDPFRDPEPLIARIYAYVAYRLGQGAEAEDVTSETFARALRYRDTYDPARGAPITWLIAIAQRCVAESLRYRSALAEPPDVASDEDLEATVVERVALFTAISQLGERDQELIALRYGADLSTREIAERFDANPGSVDVALHRARTRLRALLEDRSGEPPAAEL